MRSASIIVCFCLLSCCAFPHLARAEAGAPVVEKERGSARDRHAQRVEARARFRRGTELYEEGDFQAALAEFLRANELSPHPLSLFNIANCYVQLNRYEEAIRAYTESIQEGRESLGPRRLQAARAEIERLQSLIATITLSVNLPMAEVILDGESLGEVQGERELRVSAGTHVVEVRADGYQTARRELTVAGGMSSRLDIEMVRQARLNVDAETSDAELYIDGHRAGRTPFSGGVPMGRHSLRVERDGYLTWEGEVEATPGRTIDVRVELQSGRRRLSSAWFWVDLSLTLALGVAATVTGVLALQRQDEYDALVRQIDAGDYEQAELSQLRARGLGLMEEIDAFALACDINLGLLGAFAVGAVVFGLLSDLGRQGSRADIQLSLRRGAAWSVVF